MSGESCRHQPQDSPDIVFLADRDRDGRAEVRETLFTGFKPVIIERRMNSPQWGPDNWIYIHAPEVKVGRIQNFKNWSPDMVPDPTKNLIGLEYLVQEGDDLWTASDEELVARGRRECAWLGLVEEKDVTGGTVIVSGGSLKVTDRSRLAGDAAE